MLVQVPLNCHFTIYNIPFGIFSHENSSIKRCGSAIGDFIIDLHEMTTIGLLDMKDKNIFDKPHLNDFISLGRPIWKQVRQTIINHLQSDNKEMLRCLIPMKACQLHRPVTIGDYTDFYASIDHATNVGKASFRL